MKREETLNEILALLIAKRDYAVISDKITEEIDTRAKQIEMKPYERTKLILQVNEIMNHKI